jgi:RNA polymerase sigma-70 factor (ECF subfamily)
MQREVLMIAETKVEQDFETQRPRLFAIAYRMLGSAAEAEDIVQEAWLRRRRTSDVDSEAAWLTTTVTRLCLDQLKSARVRREHYVGPWLPEPIDTSNLGEEAVDPETISTAFLLLLERLTPTERAVLLLRQVYELDYAQIAETLGKSESAIRQLHHRARAHVDQAKPRFTARKEDHQRLPATFVEALASGEHQKVEALLAHDVQAWNDGGGRTRAALKVVHGRTNVAKLYLGLAKRLAAGSLHFEWRELNGAPSLIVWADAQALYALTIESDGALIQAIHVVLNPEKLAHLRRQS